jgi:hypothetical protein
MFNQFLHQWACQCTSSICFYNREMTWKWRCDSSTMSYLREDAAFPSCKLSSWN